MTTVINGTTGTTIAGDATVQGNLTVTGQLIGGVPSGAVFWFAANTPPSGYLKANGAAVSRTTYAALFGVLGTTFGSGDGSTTFNLPDLRGEFIRGWDDGRGVDPARVFGSAQGGQVQWYGDGVQINTNEPGRYSGGPLGGGIAGKFVDTAVNTMDRIDFNYSTSTETRPRNVALLPCIKT